jgi:hypothetical protein
MMPSAVMPGPATATAAAAAAATTMSSGQDHAIVKKQSCGHERNQEQLAHCNLLGKPNQHNRIPTDGKAA